MIQKLSNNQKQSAQKKSGAELSRKTSVEMPANDGEVQSARIRGNQSFKVFSNCKGISDCILQFSQPGDKEEIKAEKVADNVLANLNPLNPPRHNFTKKSAPDVSCKWTDCEEKMQLYRKDSDNHEAARRNDKKSTLIINADYKKSKIQRKCNECSNSEYRMPEEDLASLQKKLTVGSANDRYEQEADQLAEQIMREPDQDDVQMEGANKINDTKHAFSNPPKVTPLVQRQTNLDEDAREEDAVGASKKSSSLNLISLEQELEEEKESEFENNAVQAKSRGETRAGLSTETASQILSLKGGGSPLEPMTRNFMEARFGEDFSRVRVHTGSKPALLANNVNAKAFTLGSDLIFGSGEYKPGTKNGRKLLAHELVHVIQQTGRHSIVKQNSTRSLQASSVESSDRNNTNKIQRKPGPVFRPILRARPQIRIVPNTTNPRRRGTHQYGAGPNQLESGWQVMPAWEGQFHPLMELFQRMRAVQTKRQMKREAERPLAVWSSGGSHSKAFVTTGNVENVLEIATSQQTFYIRFKARTFHVKSAIRRDVLKVRTDADLQKLLISYLYPDVITLEDLLKMDLANLPPSSLRVSFPQDLVWYPSKFDPGGRKRFRLIQLQLVKQAKRNKQLRQQPIIRSIVDAAPKPKPKPKRRTKVATPTNRRRRKSCKKPLEWKKGVANPTKSICSNFSSEGVLRFCFPTDSEGVTQYKPRKVKLGKWTTSVDSFLWGTQGHHTWPKYVGGDPDQHCMPVQNTVHHSVLHRSLEYFWGFWGKDVKGNAKNEVVVAKLKKSSATRQEFRRLLMTYYGGYVNAQTDPKMPESVYKKGIDDAVKALEKGDSKDE